jgi:polysaccharide pyruvyl transferase CsaB
VIVAQLRARFPYARIDVLSESPAETAHAFGVDATPRADLGAVRRAIDQADVVLSGGGGLLQNATSLKSLVYYAGIVRTAVHAKKRTMIFAQSIGPLDFIGKGVVREMCRGVTAATVRDGRSFALLSSLLPETPIRQTADPVFLYEPREGAEADDALRRSGLGADGGPLVVVSVRKTAHFGAGAAVIAAAVDRLTAVHGAHVAFLPLGGVADAEASTTVIRKCRSTPVLLPPAGLAGACRILSRAQAVIGMRLHALILAVGAGTPFLAIPYDPKVAALCEDMRYPLAPLWVPGARSEDAGIDTLVDRLWSQRDELAALTRARAVEMRTAAAGNFEVLGEVSAAPARQVL